MEKFEDISPEKNEILFSSDRKEVPDNLKDEGYGDEAWFGVKSKGEKF
ncbi:MAG: hypothetical protein Q8Q37_03265 [bacterium]|nr:hypothetical protein [bacterium]